MAVNDGDILKVVQTIEGPDLVICQNVYYWQLSDPTPDNPSNAQIITALDTRLDDMYSRWDDAMTAAYEASDFTVERIAWDGSLWETVENVGAGDINLVGQAAVGVGAPHGVAATITAQTSRPQTRARKFLPGLAEGNITDSTLNGTILGYIAQFIVSWLTDQLVVGSAELIPVVVGQSGPSAGLVYLLLSAAANGISGYQRRRKPGVGI